MPFQIIFSGCNALIVPFQQLLEAPYKSSCVSVSMTESVRDNLGKFINQLQYKTKILVKKIERILIKLCRQNVSLFFNQRGISERMLANYTHSYLYIYIYIYIYTTKIWNFIHPCSEFDVGAAILIINKIPNGLIRVRDSFNFSRTFAYVNFKCVSFCHVI